MKKKMLRERLLKIHGGAHILPDTVVSFFWMYRKYVFTGVLVLTLLSIAAIALNRNVAAKETAAFEKLAVVEKLYRDTLSDSSYESAFSEVKDRFLLIINDSHSGKVIQIAQIIFGKISYDAGSFDMAISMYSSALQKYKENIILKNIILNGLAHSHLSNGDLKRALLYFERILFGNESIMKADALFNIASIHETIGDIDEAERLYSQFMIDFPDSLYTQLVREKVVRR